MSGKAWTLHLKRGLPIEHVRGKLASGEIVEDMHFAKDLTGEDQPPFSGWFVPFKNGKGYQEVTPVAWMPMVNVE